MKLYYFCINHLFTYLYIYLFIYYYIGGNALFKKRRNEQNIDIERKERKTKNMRKSNRGGLGSQVVTKWVVT